MKLHIAFTAATDANALMVAEARLALEAYAEGDTARYDLHRLNARRIADGLGLGAQQHIEEETA